MKDMPVPDDLVDLGHVSSAFGVKGWVRIQPYSSQAHVLLDTGVWWLSPSPHNKGSDLSVATPITVVSVKPHGDSLVAQFQGLSDRDAAEGLRGSTISVSRSQFPEPDNDEYYWVDLIGCQIYGEQDGRPALLGIIHTISDNGVHAVLQVHRARLESDGSLTMLFDSKNRPLEILVPFVQAHVHTVDLAARRLDSNWPADF